MTLPDEKGFWKKSRITALLKKKKSVTGCYNRWNKCFSWGSGILTLILIWKWIELHEQLWGYHMIQRSQEPWGPLRRPIEQCTWLTCRRKWEEYTILAVGLCDGSLSLICGPVVGWDVKVLINPPQIINNTQMIFKRICQATVAFGCANMLSTLRASAKPDWFAKNNSSSI